MRRTALGQEAVRLLAALNQAGAYAFSDIAHDRALLVRGGGSGISLGGGRYTREAGETLIAADLVRREPGPRPKLRITGAGNAWLRRADGPPDVPFLAQHLDLAEVEDRTVRRLHDTSESPLAWMARRRGRDGTPLIDAAAFEAGERLRRDLTVATMLPRMGADWTAPRVDGTSGRDPAGASDTQLAARQRVSQALDAVGNDLSGLLIDLCGFLKGLERIETERRWPARSAKVVARIALGRLAEHYGLGREAVGPEHARMRLWRDRA